MKTILETTLIHNPNELCIRVPVHNDGTIDTITLERRYAGWYATLDYTDADGILRSLGPDDWVRYRNIYTLEYNTNDACYTVKITEHAETNEISICVFKERINDDGNIHANTQASAD
jgi:hypothetical protein